jgi:hypothetical protein
VLGLSARVIINARIIRVIRFVRVVSVITVTKVVRVISQGYYQRQSYRQGPVSLLDL